MVVGEHDDLHTVAQAQFRQDPADMRFDGRLAQEELCCDLGAYAHDPLGEIGYLQWRLLRLGRILADTGVHALGWSRDKAIAEMTGLPLGTVKSRTMAAMNRLRGELANVDDSESRRS